MNGEVELRPWVLGFMALACFGFAGFMLYLIARVLRSPLTCGCPVYPLHGQDGGEITYKQFHETGCPERQPERIP